MKNNPFKEALYDVAKNTTLKILDQVDDHYTEIAGRAAFRSIYQYYIDDYFKDMINKDYWEIFEGFKQETIDEVNLEIEKLIVDYCAKKGWVSDTSDDVVYKIYPTKKDDSIKMKNTENKLTSDRPVSIRIDAFDKSGEDNYIDFIEKYYITKNITEAINYILDIIEYSICNLREAKGALFLAPSISYQDIIETINSIDEHLVLFPIEVTFKDGYTKFSFEVYLG